MSYSTTQNAAFTPVAFLITNLILYREIVRQAVTMQLYKNLNMLSEPKIEYRDEQPYVAIRTKVSMQEIPTVLPPLIPEVYAWLQKNHVATDHPCFFCYHRMDKDDMLEVDVGVPVDKVLSGDDRILADVFPAGRYATVLHTGHYSNLRKAHMNLESWKEKMGLKEKALITENGAWGVRIEFYITDPEQEPNPDKWVTEIAFLLADD